MELSLHHSDLKVEHKEAIASQVEFEHFKDEVQEAIRKVGKGVFVWRGNAFPIHPPNIEN
jgi:hypothetical protein